MAAFAGSRTGKGESIRQPHHKDSDAVRTEIPWQQPVVDWIRSPGTSETNPTNAYPPHAYAPRVPIIGGSVMGH